MPVPVAASAETALQLLHILGWVLVGAALIAVAVYLALLCSEMLMDNLPQKTAPHGRAGTVPIKSAASTELPLSPRLKDQNIVEMPAARPDAQQPARVRTRVQRG